MNSKFTLRNQGVKSAMANKERNVGGRPDRDGKTRLQHVWATNMGQVLWDRQMTQAEMAKLLGIHLVRLNQYLMLSRPISLWQIERYSRILKIRPETFFIPRPPPPRYEPVLKIEALDPELDYFGD